VRKKAALCLLRLVRVNKDLVLSTDEWKNKLTPLLEDKNLGVVLSVVNTPGRYLDARTAESAKVNENTMMVLTTASGERIGVRQISGAIARRIVCPVELGTKARRAHRYGMIKFGSTTELILPRPADVQAHVSVGQRVTGGVTILATLSPPK
jgi:phosphatidylserine decarboxylase